MKGKNIESWLTANILKKECYDMNGLIKDFMSEMEKGLTSTGSSLPMIPTYIEIEKDIPKNKNVIAIDAGGTNLRVSCVKFDENGIPTIESFKHFPLPGSISEIDITEFFDIIAKEVVPVVKDQERVGFCFSFPAKIHPDKDGEILLFDKEVKVANAGGHMLGKELIEALNNNGVNSISKVVVINDTVAAALGAKAQFSMKQYGGYIGFILGTGMNACYPEQISNIEKLNNKTEESGAMLINIEAAMNDKILRGPIDFELDRLSHDPGRCPSEKMISGAYIGEVFRRSVINAAKDGLFEIDTDIIKTAATKEMSEFLENPNEGLYSGLCGDDDELRETLIAIGKSVVERAAKIAASIILSVCIKSGKGTDSKHPVFVSAEGTTFYKLKGLKDGIESEINSYLSINKNLNIVIGKSDDSTIIGSAIAAYL